MSDTFPQNRMRTQEVAWETSKALSIALCLTTKIWFGVYASKLSSQPARPLTSYRERSLALLTSSALIGDDFSRQCPKSFAFFGLDKLR